jgi:hypothetical protein
MRHFPLRELGYAIGFVVLLAGLYVGSYYAMVEKFECFGVGATSPTYLLRLEWVEPFYSVSGGLR